MGRDEETGVEYNEERRYTINDYTLDLFLLKGKLMQINLTTGFDAKLSGLDAAVSENLDTTETAEAQSVGRPGGEQISSHKAAC